MRTFVGAGLAIGCVVLGAGCTGGTAAQTSSPRPAATTPAATTPTSTPRDDVARIPMGPPARIAWWRGAVVHPAGGAAVVPLELGGARGVAGVVAYRGGYLATVLDRRERSTGRVLDASGLLVRRLDGCVSSPVRSADGRHVAWVADDCRSTGGATLVVGPSDADAAPDLAVPLELADGTAYPVEVDVSRVRIQAHDGIRGYPTGVYDVVLATGEVRRLRGPVARSYEARSPDGAQGIRRRGQEWQVVDVATGKVLRRLSLPGRLVVLDAGWEDRRTILVVAARFYDSSNRSFSTILRMTPSGDLERVAGVFASGDPSLL